MSRDHRERSKKISVRSRIAGPGRYNPGMILRVALGCFSAALLFAQDRIVLDTSTVIDGKGEVLKGRRIVINGARIESVNGGAGRATYDLRGLTVMPGWIDTHVHLDWHFDATHHITDQIGRAH